MTFTLIVHCTYLPVPHTQCLWGVCCLVLVPSHCGQSFLIEHRQSLFHEHNNHLCELISKIENSVRLYYLLLIFSFGITHSIQDCVFFNLPTVPYTEWSNHRPQAKWPQGYKVSKHVRPVKKIERVLICWKIDWIELKRECVYK